LERRSVAEAHVRTIQVEGHEIRMKSTIYGEKPEFRDLEAVADVLGASVVEVHRRIQGYSGDRESRFGS
jgi:uncharacterized protein (DUF111 family)